VKIRLPREILGKQYEEAVAAFIKSRGYFIENRLILDHNGKELLELDTVATPSNTDYSERILIDAKSGKNTGFSDIFKIYGWKEFLRISQGCIVRKIPPEDRDTEALDAYKSQLNMTWEIFDIVEDDIDTEIERSIPIIIEKEKHLSDSVFIAAWWQSISERIVKKGFDDFCKSNKGLPLIEKVKKYEKACLISFFEKDPVRRVISLYSAFKEEPYIGKQAIEYQMLLSKLTERQIQDKIFDTEELLWLQYISLLEHRARILILKSAVDICFTPEQTERKYGFLNRRILLSITPDNFQTGLDLVNACDYKHIIPYFYQILLEIFGGFYINNDEDIKMICDTCGLPIAKFKEAIEIINIFFPTSNSWWLPSKNIIRLKFVPLCLRGIGGFVRHDYYKKEYEEIDERMGWLLQKYHNSLIRLLAKDKSLVVEE
jgi:hypothetical protein